MSFRQSRTNPFYVLLVIFGIAFALTACAYSVMTLKAVRATEVDDAHAASPGLLDFLDKHGAALMGGELALLALATVGAISTDRYWMRRAYRESRSKPAQPNHEGPHLPT